MIPRALLALLEADVVAARQHLDRATAALEMARREIESVPSEPTAFDGMTARCGKCGSVVPEEVFGAHVRRCALTTKALRSAVMEETAMDGLYGRQVEV